MGDVFTSGLLNEDAMKIHVAVKNESVYTKPSFSNHNSFTVYCTNASHKASMHANQLEDIAESLQHWHNIHTLLMRVDFVPGLNTYTTSN